MSNWYDTIVSNLKTSLETVFAKKTDVPKIFYGTSSSASNAQVKEITTSSNYTLQSGTTLIVFFTYSQSYNSSSDNPMKLKVNNETAIDVSYTGNNLSTCYMWSEGEMVAFVYDGTKFILFNNGLATTSYYGVTKLSSSTTSTTEKSAATPLAVKTAYDLADSKQDALVSGTNIKTVNNNSLLGSGDVSINVPTKTSDLTNDGSDGNDTYVESLDLSAVATSGDYTDLINIPSDFIPSAHFHGRIDDTGKVHSSDSSSSSVVKNGVGVTNSSGTLCAISSLEVGKTYDANAHTNIGSSANDTQSTINSAIDTALSGKANSSHTHTMANITDYFQTTITASTYNASIDSVDTIVTVTVTDLSGNAISNKSVTLSCDKGYFNKNGSTIISGTTTKTITATTDSNGQITGTWTANEWGLCTFTCNNTNVQVNVKGWKKVVNYSSNNNNFEIYTDGKVATYVINTNNFSVTANTSKSLTTFDTKYDPIYVMGVKTISNQSITGIISSGKVEIIGTGTSGNMWGTVTSLLKTPLY